mgnify:CR=1 FL=1
MHRSIGYQRRWHKSFARCEVCAAINRPEFSALLAALKTDRWKQTAEVQDTLRMHLRRTNSAKQCPRIKCGLTINIASERMPDSSRGLSSGSFGCLDWIFQRVERWWWVFCWCGVVGFWVFQNIGCFGNLNLEILYKNSWLSYQRFF